MVGEKIAGVDPERAVMDVALHLFDLGHADATLSAPLATATPAEAFGLAFDGNTRSMTADDLNRLELQRLNA